MKRLWLALLIFVPALVSRGQNYNSYQPLPPFKGNYVRDTAVCTPTPTPTPTPTNTPTPTPTPTNTPTPTPTPTATPSEFHYGYPGCGSCTSSSTIKAQWLFDEASGDIVDEVGSVALTSVGAPTYGVTFASPYSEIDPCITITDAADSFIAALVPAALKPGTNDFQFEWWEKHTATGTKGVYDSSNDGGAGCEIYWTGTVTLHIDCQEGAGNGFSGTWTVTGTPNDGVLHKYRALFDRDGNATLYVNGSTMGDVDISAGVSKNIGGVGPLVMGALGTGVLPIKATMCEFRFQFGDKSNFVNSEGG